MRSRLERRYRALLRVLPRWYRAEREEEMVGILLADRDDDLDLEYGWPGWGETGATLGLAVRVRLGARRPAGALVRLVALTGLLGQVAASAQSWTVTARFGLAGGPQDWWYDVLAAVAFGALVSGRRTAGRVAAAALGVAGLLSVVWSLTAGAAPWSTALWQLPVLVTGAAALLGFHREAPPVPARWWATAPVAIAAGAASVVFTPVLSTATMLTAWLIAALVVAAVRPWTARKADRAPVA